MVTAATITSPAAPPPHATGRRTDAGADRKAHVQPAPVTTSTARKTRRAWVAADGSRLEPADACTDISAGPRGRVTAGRRSGGRLLSGAEGRSRAAGRTEEK